MSPELRLLLLGFSAVILIAAAAWVMYKVRMTPAERERRRREMLNRIGRMKDGMVTDISEDTLFYHYDVMGVEYVASQQVDGLEQQLPANLGALVGPVTLKYAPRNPANSIVVCEDWSGLRQDSQVKTQHPKNSSLRA